MNAPALFRMDIDVEPHHEKPQPLMTRNNRVWWTARPMNYAGLLWRLKLAWGVFIGKYDALKWGGDQ